MGRPQSSIRIHEHAGTVGVSFPDSEQFYLTGADARALARELTRFANSVGGNALARHTHPVARIICDGKAVNEADGLKRCDYLG